MWDCSQETIGKGNFKVTVLTFSSSLHQFGWTINTQHTLCVWTEWSGLQSEGLWGVMNGQVTGFFPSSVFQVSPGYTPDFWSASANTTHTAFHHHTAKLCPAASWWSWHRGYRLLWEWYHQVRKATLMVNRAGVTFNVNPKSSAQDYLIAWRAFLEPALLLGSALLLQSFLCIP